jgi:uncharacterized protein
VRVQHLLLTLLIALSPCLTASGAEIPADKRQEIEKLLRLSGVESRMAQMSTLMISALKAKMTDVPPDFWVKFEQKINTHDLLDKIIPLYDKYFSTEDLKAVNAFYASPAGQRILAALPQIMQESMKMGMEWGEAIGKQAAEETAQSLKKTQ